MEYLKCVFRVAESPLGVPLQEGVLLGVIDRLLEARTPPCTRHCTRPAGRETSRGEI